MYLVAPVLTQQSCLEKVFIAKEYPVGSSDEPFDRREIENQIVSRINHYAVGCDGEIFEGQDIRNKGAHISFGNTSIIGIVLMSDLDEQWWDSDYEVTPLQEKAVKKSYPRCLTILILRNLAGTRNTRFFTVIPKSLTR